MVRLAKGFISAFFLVSLSISASAQKVVDPKGADQKPYTNDFLASDAVRYQGRWKTDLKPTGQTIPKLKAAAAARLS